MHFESMEPKLKNVMFPEIPKPDECRHKQSNAFITRRGRPR